MICFASQNIYLHGQDLPENRLYDWSIAGLKDSTTQDFIRIDMMQYELDSSGQMPCDSIVALVLEEYIGQQKILEFPQGEYLFNAPIILSSNTVIKGGGHEETIFLMDLKGSGNAIEIKGQTNVQDTFPIIETGLKDNYYVQTLDSNDLSKGDWVKLYQFDEDLVFSSWAHNSVAQMLQVAENIAGRIYFRSPLRIDYDIDRQPKLQRFEPVENVGIECVKILRLDDTAPQQSSNVFFSYAVNCWINGLESENCTFSHIDARHSSRLEITNSYFHHAFDYGGGGRAYGVMLHSSSNECLIYDNVFEHLRHSMILQSGANGNVFSYNYSFDPFWESFPSNSAGDAVLHGNFPFANLFEQNICQNIVIDNSHGSNGPHNTMFRNRAESYGIFFSASNSPNQNIIANEISNTDFPFSLVNYTIQGDDHFLYGNNNKGDIHPDGTDSLESKSQYLMELPSFLVESEFGGIGTPYPLNTNTIPAEQRVNSGDFIRDCFVEVLSNTEKPSSKTVVNVFPNPTIGPLFIRSNQDFDKLIIANAIGSALFSKENIPGELDINLDYLDPGLYFISIISDGKLLTTKTILKN